MQFAAIVSKVTIITNGFLYITQFCILAIVQDYYLYIVAALLMQALTNIITAIAADKLYPQYKAQGKLSAEQIKSINHRIKDLFTAKLGGVVVNSADTIVVSAFLGLTVLAI